MRSTHWLFILALAAAAVIFGCRAGEVRSSPSQPKPEQAGEASAIAWLDGYEDGLRQARDQSKPLMVLVSAPWCSACKKLEQEVLSRADVAELSQKFITVKVNGDNRRDLVTKLSVSGYPTTVFLTADEHELGRVRGAVFHEDMLEAMREALDEFAKPR